MKPFVFSDANFQRQRGWSKAFRKSKCQASCPVFWWASCPWVIKHGRSEFNFKSRIYEWCSNMKTITNVYSCRDFPASRVWIRKGNHLVTIFWNTLHHVLSVGIAQGTGELIEKTGIGIICHPGLAVGDHSFFQVQTMFKKPTLRCLASPGCQFTMSQVGFLRTWCTHGGFSMIFHFFLFF